MTPVKIEVLVLYYSSAEVADVTEVAVSSILCLPMLLLGRDAVLADAVARKG